MSSSNDRFSEKFEHLEQMPEFKKGFADSWKEPVIERRDEESDFSDMTSAEFDQLIDHYSRDLEIKSRWINEIKSLIENVEAADDKALHFERLLTLALYSSKAVEQCFRKHRDTLADFPKSQISWPVIMSKFESGWKSSNMPSRVEDVYSLLYVPEQKAKADRLGVWVYACLKGLLEIRKCPYNYALIYESPEWEEVEEACKLPEIGETIDPPLLTKWTGAIFKKLFRECGPNLAHETSDPSDLAFCRIHLQNLLVGYLDPEYDEGELENIYSIAEWEIDEMCEYVDQSLYSKNPYACSLFKDSASSALRTKREKSIGQLNVARRTKLERFKDGERNPSLYFASEIKDSLSGKPLANALQRIRQEREAYEAVYYTQLESAKGKKLTESEFKEAAKKDIKYRLELILGKPRKRVPKSGG